MSTLFLVSMPMIVGVRMSVIMGVHVSMIVGVRVSMSVIMGVRVPMVLLFLKRDVGLCAPLACALKHLHLRSVRVTMFSMGVAVVMVAVSMVAVRMAMSYG